MAGDKSTKMGGIDNTAYIANSSLIERLLQGAGGLLQDGKGSCKVRGGVWIGWKAWGRGGGRREGDVSC